MPFLNTLVFKNEKNRFSIGIDARFSIDETLTKYYIFGSKVTLILDKQGDERGTVTKMQRFITLNNELGTQRVQDLLEKTNQ